MFKLGGESIEVSVIVMTSRDAMKCHASRVPKILRQITHEFVWYGTRCRGRVVGIEFGMLANPIGLCVEEITFYYLVKVYQMILTNLTYCNCRLINKSELLSNSR